MQEMDIHTYKYERRIEKLTREEFDSMVDRIRNARDDDESERGREEFWEAYQRYGEEGVDATVDIDELKAERDRLIEERDRYSAELDDQRRLTSKVRERNGELMKRIGMTQPQDEDYAEPEKDKESYDLDSLFDEKGNLF